MQTKLTIILTLCAFVALAQEQKQDTIKVELKPWQVEQINKVSEKIKELEEVRALYIEAIISTIVDPKKVRYGFNKKGELIIIK